MREKFNIFVKQNKSNLVFVCDRLNDRVNKDNNKKEIIFFS